MTVRPGETLADVLRRHARPDPDPTPENSPGLFVCGALGDAGRGTAHVHACGKTEGHAPPHACASCARTWR